MLVNFAYYISVQFIEYAYIAESAATQELD